MLRWILATTVRRGYVESVRLAGPHSGQARGFQNHKPST
jgi:hypothetical protein